MRRKKIVISILSALIGIFFILPAIGFGILKWAILPPEKLTPLVVEKTNAFIKAHLDCEKVELTYFETYPHLGIELTNGRLISHQAEDSTAHNEELAIPSDSLLSFQKAIIVFNPTDYLFKGTITIGKIILESPRFYGFVNKEGKANWDIYQTENDSTETDSNSKPLPPIDLQQVQILNGKFTYNDLKQDLFTEINGFSLHLNGSLSNGGNKLDLETNITSILFRNPSYTLSNKLEMRLKSRLLLSNNYQMVTLQGAELMVNNLPFTADGSVATSPETRNTQINMSFGLKVSDMNDLLKFIPDAYFQNQEKTLAQGRILLEGNVIGELGDSIIPTVNLCCKIEDGSYHIQGIKQGIDTLQMDVDLHLNGLHPGSSYISLEELTIKGLNTSLNMQGEVRNILQNPAVNAQLKGKIDFTRLAEEFLNQDTLLLRGILEADLKTTFTLDDVLNSHFGKIKSEGKLDIDQFKAYSKPLDMDIYIAGAHLFVGSTQKESKYLNASQLLNATLTMDTMNIKYKDEISTNISKLEMVANTTPTIDTSAVIPLTARIQFDHLRSKMPDSTWIIAGQTIFRGGLKASASNKQIPTAGATISVDTLKYFYIPLRSGAILTESTFNIEALPYREALRQQRENRTNQARNNNARKARDTSGQVQIDTTSVTNKLLRQWEARGNVQFKQMRIVSRLLPLPIRMDETNMKFNTNNITLSDARLHLGKSDLTLSGEIKRIRQALLRNGKLKGDFSLVSNYIDCNQLMTAMNTGMMFSEQLSSTKTPNFNDDNIASMDASTVQEIANTAEADTTDQLFVVPQFLDLTFHTNAKQIDFKDLELKDVTGEVVVRNQSINLNNLHMDSNIGSGDLTMVYTTPDKRGATLGFDLDMNDILVNKLIGLFPAMDTLVPMLRSFEGVVDCQMTATCQTDSTMSVLLPTLNSSCFLSGKNMVLLDGETFAEISKTLMFKNKERNVIDSIAVDLAIKDNKIEVFPFLAEIDRYKVAIGGTHNLDMTFDYHISVLKSPVPFKLGIDIKGNLDNFKYKIVKCKYKDFVKPAKQAELDSTRRNIRQDIRDAIREQIKAVAPELAFQDKVNDKTE